MRRTLLILWFSLVLSACSSGQQETAADQPPVETTKSSAPAAPGPFEVAEEWLTADVTGPTADILQRLSEPGIERMHRAAPGIYKVLIAGNDSDADAVLLTIERGESGWSVTEAVPARADYLWPSQ